MSREESDQEEDHSSAAGIPRPPVYYAPYCEACGKDLKPDQRYFWWAPIVTLCHRCFTSSSPLADKLYDRGVDVWQRWRDQIPDMRD